MTFLVPIGLLALATLPLIVLSSSPALVSATATGASLVPVRVMVRVELAVSPCSSVTV